MSASSSSDFAVETVMDLLDGEADTTWTNDPPEVFALQDLSPRQRENNEDDALYVWSPVDSDLSPFSADQDNLDQTDTVEVVVATLNETRTARLIEDVVDVLSQYMADNESNTNFRTVEPTSASDDRGQQIVRSTNHYTGSVTVDLNVLRATGT